MYIPFIYVLIFLLSKEFFSYDSERIVIFCIISFFLLAYYGARDLLNNEFHNKSARLKNEYLDVVAIKLKLETNLKELWALFSSLEAQLFICSSWIKNIYKNLLTKLNINRYIFLSHVSKDDVNIFTKNFLINDFYSKNIHILENELNFIDDDLIYKNFNLLKNFINYSKSSTPTFFELIEKKVATTF